MREELIATSFQYLELLNSFLYVNTVAMFGCWILQQIKKTTMSLAHCDIFVFTAIVLISLNRKKRTWASIDGEAAQLCFAFLLTLNTATVDQLIWVNTEMCTWASRGSLVVNSNSPVLFLFWHYTRLVNFTKYEFYKNMYGSINWLWSRLIGGGRQLICKNFHGWNLFL